MVLAVIMILAGLLTVKTLPVAQFPDITPPTVNVSASYPGANAETVASVIGAPIEEQVNGVEGMMYMSSSSGSDGSYNLTITFDVGTDLDMATVKVQNRVSRAEPTLPSAVKQQGVQVTSRSTNIILFVALESDGPERYGTGGRFRSGTVQHARVARPRPDAGARYNRPGGDGRNPVAEHGGVGRKRGLSPGHERTFQLHAHIAGTA